MARTFLPDDNMIRIKCPRCQRLLLTAESVNGPVEIRNRDGIYRIEQVQGQIVIQCPKCQTSLRWPSNQAEVASGTTLIQE